MKKSIKLSIVASAIIASNLNASQSISIQKGWNLIGTNQDINISELNSTNLVWSWDNNWSVKDFTNSYNPNLAQYSPLESIKAGNGVWVYSDKIQTLSLDGKAPTDTKLSIKKGWQLKSLKDNKSLPTDSFTADDNITSVWGYKNNKWQLYIPNSTLLDTIITSNSTMMDKLKSISPSDGFWVNSGSDIPDIIASATLITGSVNLDGLDNSNNKGNGKILYKSTGLDTPPAVPGVVQVYDTNDTNYEEPLLKEPIDINDDGTYNVTKSNFTDENKADSSNGFIIRAIVEKDNGDGTKTKYDLSALKTEGTDVEISPVTTAVKAKILQTIKTLFGDDFKLDNKIMTTVNTLSTQISTQIKEEVKAGKISLRAADFITNAKIKQDKTETVEEKQKREEAEKKIREEQESRISLQLASTNASQKISILSNQLSDIKKDDLKDNISDDLKISDIYKNEDLARLQFDIISKFTKTGLGVHNGKGGVILYLPVAPEDFNTLPGKMYQITSKFNTDKNITIGDDPALRVIDIEKDLKNINGSEIWLPELQEKLLNMPIVPFNGVLDVLKNIDNTISLEDFGNYLASDEIDSSIKLPENPFLNLYGTDLSEDIDKSIEDILTHYKNAFILQDFDWIFNDQLNKILTETDIEDTNATTDAITEFIDKFKAPDSLDENNTNEFLKSLDDSASESIDDRFHNLFNLIADGIPYDNGDDNLTLLQFKNGLTINKDSEITIPTALTLLNLAMDTRDLPTLESVSINDLTSDEGRLGWLPEDIKTILNDNDSDLIVANDNEDNNNKTIEPLVMKKFITNIISKITGVQVTAEPSLGKVLGQISKISEKLNKLAQKQENNFFENQFNDIVGNPFFDDATDGKKDTLVSFKIVNFKGIPNSAVSSVVFTPMLENRDTFQWVESNNSIIFTKDNNLFENNVTLYDDNIIKLDKFGNIDENGKYRQTEMFKVKIYQGTDSFEIGEFQIFPQPDNNLDTLSFDSQEMNFDDIIPMDDAIFNENFNEFNLNDDNKSLFYPNLEYIDNGKMLGENILQFDNGVFSIIENMAGTLAPENNGKVELFKLASNYDEADKIWMNNNFNPTDYTNITKFNVNSDGDIKQGGLILAKISSDKIISKKIIISIDNIDDNVVDISFLDVPDMFNFNPNGDTPKFDDINSTVKFKIKKFNNTLNNKVKSVTFNPWVISENGDLIHIEDGYKAIIKPIIGGAFKGEVSIKSKYDELPSNGMFEVIVTYIDNNGDEQNSSLGDFPLMPSDENFLGDLFFDIDNIDNYIPNKDGDIPIDNDMMMDNKILPKNDMNTSVNFVVTNQDGEPNLNVKSIKIIPVLENIDTKEWKSTNFLGKDVNLSTNAELNTTILLEPDSKIFTNNGAKWVYTGQFEFVATMDNNKSFPVGEFPLFAQPDNNLTWFTVDASWLDNSDDFFDPDEYKEDIKEDIKDGILNKF